MTSYEQRRALRWNAELAGRRVEGTTRRGYYRIPPCEFVRVENIAGPGSPTVVLRTDSGREVTHATSGIDDLWPATTGDGEPS